MFPGAVFRALAYIRRTGTNRRNCAASVRRISCELLHKALVAVVEQAQVVDAVAQHRQAFDARAESEADVFFRIQAEIADQPIIILNAIFHRSTLYRSPGEAATA